MLHAASAARRLDLYAGLSRFSLLESEGVADKQRPLLYRRASRRAVPPPSSMPDSVRM